MTNRIASHQTGTIFIRGQICACSKSQYSYNNIVYLLPCSHPRKPRASKGMGREGRDLGVGKKRSRGGEGLRDNALKSAGSFSVQIISRLKSKHH